MGSLTQTAGRSGSPRQSEFQCLRTAPARNAGKRAAGVSASEFVASRAGCVASVPGPRVPVASVASSVASSCSEYRPAASRLSSASSSSLPGSRVAELVELRRVEFAYPGCLARSVRPPGVSPIVRSMSPLRADVPRIPSNPRSVLRVAFRKLDSSRRDKVLASLSRRFSGSVSGVSSEVASASVEFGSESRFVASVASVASVECELQLGASLSGEAASKGPAFLSSASPSSASVSVASVASRVGSASVSSVSAQRHASGSVQSSAVASRRVECPRHSHGAPGRLQ